MILTVAIVTYNRESFIDGCLQTVYGNLGFLEDSEVEVIVVDNGSTDNTLGLLAKKFPAVRVIALQSNMGLTKGVNTALQYARGDFFLLLDSDTELDADVIRCLLDFMKSHPRAGVVGPKLVYADGTEQGASKAFPTPAAAFFGRKSLLTRVFPQNPFSRRYLISKYISATGPYPVDSTSAACMLVRQTAIAQTGGMDQDFFMYWGDVDWCRVMKEHGWEIYVVPSARVVHFESQTIMKQRPQAIIGFHQGVYQYYCKHHAKSRWHPMRYAALAGLTLRTGVLLAHNAIRSNPRKAGSRTSSQSREG
ncbi:MAG: glycosyltransferase family 2 protein [Chloroflexi bacterium]|nr:glycosyltransferase family 2 protein [Chloroflexota bacterium]